MRDTDNAAQSNSRIRQKSVENLTLARTPDGEFPNGTRNKKEDDHTNSCLDDRVKDTLLVKQTLSCLELIADVICWILDRKEMALLLKNH